MLEGITTPSAGNETIFSYSDVFFSCFHNDESLCVHKSKEHAINYVYSGEMIIDDGKEKIHVRKGESVFIRRDHRVTIYKKSLEGEAYCGIFMMFTRKFLREMYQKQEINKTLPKRLNASVVKLPPFIETESLFASMVPYFNRTQRAKDDFMHLKMQEGLLALLHIDEKFAPVLFDFTEPWKIDILDFMNQNYMYELSLGDIANFTGRSLASFKRDFKKISPVTPQKWLINKRLEVACQKIADEGKKVQDVYAEVGFKNPSHFTTAFKRKYGVPPTAVKF